VALKDQILFGSYVEGQSVSALETKLNASLKVVNQFFQWGDDFSSFLNGMGSRIPLVTIEPWNYSEQQVANGSADSYLKSAANWIKNYGKPVYIRPFHEANGDWYPWAVKSGQEGTFKSAWSHMASILRQAPNVKLVWCVNADTVNAADPAGFYPGSSLVDILAIDGYNWNGTSFESVHGSMYSKLSGLGSQDIWVCETACGEDVGSSTKADWVNKMFASTKFPRMKAVCWFSVNKEKDWRIDSSTASLGAFKSNLAGGTGGDTPPPPPPPPSGGISVGDHVIYMRSGYPYDNQAGIVQKTYTGSDGLPWATVKLDKVRSRKWPNFRQKYLSKI
jgi:endoglucanase